MRTGDLDRDCDGTLLLAEQGEPVSLRRTVEVVLDARGEDRFEPTDFVDGTLVDFDPVSREGGTVARGSLIYTPPDGFIGTDSYTFFMEGDDDVVRQVEVVVEVVEAVAVSEGPTDAPSASDVDQADEDAADRALAVDRVEVRPEAPRWDPPWLIILSLIAGVLLATAAAWWLLIIVRIQDRWRDD